MNSLHPFRSHSAASVRRGFTLVEMMVSVGLVVLMMSLFAQVFQIAAGTLTLQKGITENDQRERMLDTILRADLDKRTYRDVRACDPTESGYFYISENNPNDDTDDVLQFTIRTTNIQKNTDQSRLYGSAISLTNVKPVDPNINQPDAEDPQPFTSSASAGEVSYFLRNGNLYRRVLMIRERLNLNFPAQPTNSSGTQLISGPYPSGAAGLPVTPTRFWRDFDFSAYWNTNAVPATCFFHSDPESLDLTGFPATTKSFGFANNSQYSLGFPAGRFGHDPLNALGNPREYANVWGGTSYAGAVFFGRFTKQETASDAFVYPGNLYALPAQPPPHTPMDSVLTLGSNLSGIGQEGVMINYASPTAVAPVLPAYPRRSEDLLLSHVHSFDVKIWDTGLNGPGHAPAPLPNPPIVPYYTGAQFVDLGNTTALVNPAGGPAASPYALQCNNNTAYGNHPSCPNPNGYGNCFDTWHISIGPIAPNANAILPPYLLGPDQRPGIANYDDDGNGITDINGAGQWDIGEIGAAGSDDTPRIQAIQITIRYLDVSSNQLRQVTIQHSLVDD